MTTLLPAAPGPLTNPLKGWAAYSEPDNQHSLPVSMAYFYRSWRELEPQRGKFAFDAWERHWDNPAALDKHVVLRLYLDYPGQPCGIPQWVVDSGVKLTPYEKLAPDIPKGLHPDYSDPRLLEPLMAFIGAMGARFNKHPRVGFIAVGTLGFWGEWHTWPKNDWFPGREVQLKVLNAYKKAFPDKILLARYPADRVTAEADWLGYHDDFFPEDTEGPEDWKFLPMLRRGGRTENWKRAALGGEMVPGQATKWLGEGWEQTKRMTDATHLSWIGPYCPANESKLTPEQKNNAHALVRQMGYQFRLTELTKDKTKITLQGVNEGVAPFYYRWPLELAVMDPLGRLIKTIPLSDDIRTWQPGRFTLTFDTTGLPEGRLGLGIKDPGTGKCAVRFANALPSVNGWMILPV